MNNFMRTIAAMACYQKTGFIPCKRLPFGGVHLTIAGMVGDPQQKHPQQHTQHPAQHRRYQEGLLT